MHDPIEHAARIMADLRARHLPEVHEDAVDLIEEMTQLLREYRAREAGFQKRVDDLEREVHGLRRTINHYNGVRPRM